MVTDTPPSTGYVADLERVAQLVADWYAQTVMDIYHVLMPDGRPFDYVDNPQQKMNDYLALRGNEQAWLEYFWTEAQNIMQKLQQSGLPQDKILAVHPYNLAQLWGLEFSVEMENHLRKGEETPNA